MFGLVDCCAVDTPASPVVSMLVPTPVVESDANCVSFLMASVIVSVLWSWSYL